MSEYKHPEAFCIMNYKCEKCGRYEILWNSRDGVTPFCVSCQYCDGMSQHIDWQSDKCMPDNTPLDSQRVFIDMTKDKMSSIYMKRINAYWDDEKYPMKEQFKTKGEALESLLQGWDESVGDPDVITGKEYKGAVSTQEDKP